MNEMHGMQPYHVQCPNLITHLLLCYVVGHFLCVETFVMLNFLSVCDHFLFRMKLKVLFLLVEEHVFQRFKSYF